MKKNKIQSFLKIITALIFVFIAFPINQIEAGQDRGQLLCCPTDPKYADYKDSFTHCLADYDYNHYCCKITWDRLFFSEDPLIEAVAKVPCAEVYKDQPLRTVIPDPYYLTESRFASLNPLHIFGANHVLQEYGKLQPAGIFNRALYFLFPLAGLILFLMLVWGGFEMLIGAAKKQNLDAGKQRVTAAVIGFVLLFVSYWLVQIIEYITGVRILG